MQWEDDLGDEVGELRQPDIETTGLVEVRVKDLRPAPPAARARPSRPATSSPSRVTASRSSRDLVPQQRDLGRHGSTGQPSSTHHRARASRPTAPVPTRPALTCAASTPSPSSSPLPGSTRTVSTGRRPYCSASSRRCSTGSPPSAISRMRPAVAAQRHREQAEQVVPPAGTEAFDDAQDHHGPRQRAGRRARRRTRWWSAGRRGSPRESLGPASLGSPRPPPGPSPPRGSRDPPPRARERERRSHSRCRSPARRGRGFP